MHVLCASLREVFRPPLGVGARNRPRTVESAAFQSLVFVYASKAHRVMWALLGSSALASDVNMEVFARAYGQLEKHPQPWLELLRIGLVECRRRRWRAAFCRICKALETSNCDRRERALSVLGRLSWEDRVLLALREVGGLSTNQVAYVLGRADQDIRSDLYAARQHLSQSARGIINESQK